SPESADRRLVSTDQLRLPSSTNKAVNPIRRSSAGVQTHMNHNDRGVLCQNRFIASMGFFSRQKINFRPNFETACEFFHSVRPLAGREFQRRGCLWIAEPRKQLL